MIQVMPQERMQHLAAELALTGSASATAPSAAPPIGRRGYVQSLLSPERMQAYIRERGAMVEWGNAESKSPPNVYAPQLDTPWCQEYPMARLQASSKNAAPEHRV